MGYRVPTLDEMQLFLVALFKGLFPSRNVGSRFSFYWKLIKVIAGAVTDVHAHMNVATKDVMPSTTSKTFLDRWLGILGDARKSATPARKSAAGRVTGTAGTSVPSESELLHRASGQTFKVSATATIGVGGTVDVDIVGISTGSTTRLRKGEVLEFTSPIANVATLVRLVKDLDEDGYDAELDGSALSRLLALFGQPTAGGNQADFVRWMLAVQNISAAYCYPNRAGIGSVDVAALHTGTGSVRYLSSGERATLLATLQALAPTQLGGTGGALRVLETVGEQVNVEVALTTNGEAAYAFDWDDSSPPVVLSWTAASRLLTFTATRPATMKAGDRIVIKGVASDQSCAPVVIESLSGTTAVVLQSVPTKKDGTEATPAATDIVYAGGPLTSTIRDAIVAHINSDVLYAYSTGPLPGATAAALGISTANMRVLLDGIGTSNPLGVYGAWTGSLRLGAIATICHYTRGVRQHQVVTPSADTESTDYAFPLDAQVGVLEVGSILVRKAV